jgi:6-phosphogluconolactonase
MNAAPTRRWLLRGAALSALVPYAFGAGRNPDMALFVGTSSADQGRGLVRLSYNPITDRLLAGAPVETIRDASFAAYSRRFGLHYILDEQAEGIIGVYRAAGSDWTKIGEASSHGDGPTYVSLDKTEHSLAVANYNSGSIAFYKLDANGMPREPDVRQDSGHGPVADRQAGPHAHWARFSPDQRFLYTIDLGSDQVLAYPFDAQNRAIGAVQTAFQAPPGSGPRHMAFHPHLPLCYLASELANTLTVLHRSPSGDLAPLQTLSTLPADFTAHNQVAHIDINRGGTRLYVSNRGHNSIAVFALGKSGQAKLIQHASTQGDWPRFFLLLDHRLIVANERSGDLAVFKLAADGTLHATPSKLPVTGALFIGQVG